MIINFSTKKCFRSIPNTHAVKSKRERGPCFGNSELRACKEPFNEWKSGHFSENKESFNIPFKEVANIEEFEESTIKNSSRVLFEL
jgi:hypothetical protein